MTFAQPLWLLAVLVILPLAWLRKRRGRIRVASVSLHRASPGSFLFRTIPSTLLVSAITLAAMVLADPRIAVNETSDTTVMGRDIILALDYSGSMADGFDGELPERDLDDAFEKEWSGKFIDSDPSLTELYGSKETDFEVRRIEAAQAAILRFVDLRREAANGDAIGLIAFDDVPLLRWPLDRDLKQITRHGNFVPRGRGPHGLGGGTNFGTTIPGPIDLAASHFEERGQSITRVLILVTDGENELDNEVLDRLASVIENNDIQLFLIGVGETLASIDVDIVRLCRRVDGEVFRVEDSGSLTECFERINSLTSSPVTVTTRKTQEPYFELLLAAAALVALAWALAEGLIGGR